MDHSWEEFSYSEELIGLEATYVWDESAGLSICGAGENKTEVSIHCFPSTAMDDSTQFVRCTLTLKLDENYPTVPPEITLSRCQGLSDSQISELQKALQTTAEQHSAHGEPQLIPIVETARDKLTHFNSQLAVECCVCLMPFEPEELEKTWTRSTRSRSRSPSPERATPPEDTVWKMACYHVGHFGCLTQWCRQQKETYLQKMDDPNMKLSYVDKPKLEYSCPICRKPLEESELSPIVDVLQSDPPPPPSPPPQDYSGASPPPVKPKRIIHTLQILNWPPTGPRANDDMILSWFSPFNAISANTRQKPKIRVDFETKHHAELAYKQFHGHLVYGQKLYCQLFETEIS